MMNRNWIQEGIDRGLIRLDGEKNIITYIFRGNPQGKRRNYGNPEEKVQAETFLKLVLVYGYDPANISMFEGVTIGSSAREADIIVYDDKGKAHIVVECKKESVSEEEFNQAIEQAFSYAATGGVRAKYFWVTSKIKNSYFLIPDKEPKNRRPLSDIPYYGKSEISKYKYVKGGILNRQQLYDIETVDESQLTQRFKQAHNALWSGGELNPSAAFDELDKLIFCKIWDEQKPRKDGEPYDFQIFTEITDEKTNQGLKDRIFALYEEGRKKSPEVFKEDIRLTPEKLRTVVGYLESINLVATDLDSKGRAFETFMSSFFRGDFGQFFTPRPIVQFVVSALPITNTSLVLDTSCGSGGFLLHALDKIRKQANKYHKANTVQHYKHWHGFAEKNLYGIEINEQISRVAKMNMIIHDDGHTNVIAADGLLPAKDLVQKTTNKGFKNNRFDFIITNPPFGSTIRQVEKGYSKNYDMFYKAIDWLEPNSARVQRPNQSTEILFIEQCHNFLTEGGYLAIVLPDGVLTNSSLQYVRDSISEKFRIVAVVSLPQTAFSATGAGVKCSVLFLKKYSADFTQALQNKKTQLQDEIKEEAKYWDTRNTLAEQKSADIKALADADVPKNMDCKKFIKSDEYKARKAKINAEYKNKIDSLKERLTEEYMTRKQNILEDYPVFMAIAEDIGYDATGRPTKNNELNLISDKIVKFIQHLENKIDEYLLGELGINLPAKSDNALQDRIFIRQFNKIGSRRFDPFYYKIEFENAVKMVDNSIYELKKLKTLSCFIESGSRPQGGVANIRSGVLSFGGEHVNHQCEIEIKKPKYIPVEYHQKNLLTETKLNDVLLVKDGATTGKIGIISDINHVGQNINEHVFLIRFYADINPEYFVNLLNTTIYQILIKRIITGATVTGLTKDVVMNMEIPVPPLKKQNEIVKHIAKIRTKAKQLQQQAKAELERAKKEMEDMILGER